MMCHILSLCCSTRLPTAALGLGRAVGGRKAGGGRAGGHVEDPPRCCHDVGAKSDGGVGVD